MYLTTNVKEKNSAPAFTSAKQFQFFQIDLTAILSPDNQQTLFFAVATFLKVPNKFVLKILAFITHNF
jgi:hypothetical protein